MSDQDNNKFKPPYMSFQTFWHFIGELGKKPLPPQIDRSLMESKSGSDQANLTAALKGFGLIREDLTVEPLLDELVNAEEAERKKILARILEHHYAAPLQVSAGNGTEKQLQESFKDAFGLASAETRRKAVTFFLHAARTAGLELSPHFPPTRSGTSGPGGMAKSKRTSPKRPKAAAGTGLGVVQQQRTATGDSYTVPLKSGGGTVTVTVNVNLFGLDTRDRDFVIDLIDKLKGYAEANVDEDAASEGGDG